MEREALVLDLVEWLAPAPRPYAEVQKRFRVKWNPLHAKKPRLSKHLERVRTQNRWPLLLDAL